MNLKHPVVVVIVFVKIFWIPTNFWSKEIVDQKKIVSKNFLVPKNVTHKMLGKQKFYQKNGCFKFFLVQNILGSKKIKLG